MEFPGEKENYSTLLVKALQKIEKLEKELKEIKEANACTCCGNQVSDCWICADGQCNATREWPEGADAPIYKTCAEIRKEKSGENEYQNKIQSV